MTEQIEAPEAGLATARSVAASLPPSVLINITTPGSRISICRVGTKQELLGDGAVKQLLERCISLRSPLSMGVPIAQLESEMGAVLAIGELMAAGTAEVLLLSPDGSPQRTVAMEEPVHDIARERTGEQGNVFYKIDLEVRTAEGFTATTIEERRQVTPPTVLEAKPTPSPAPAAAKPAAAPPEIPTIPLKDKPPAAVAAPPPRTPITPLRDKPPAATTRPPAPAPAAIIESPMAGAARQGSATKPKEEVQAPAAPSKDVVVIVAGPQKKTLSMTAQAMKEKGYLRKADWLRAQFLPEVEALDFSGLFVGDFGFGIRQERERKNVVLADPSRITDVLLQGNSFRRSANHAKALTCYQELVDMDPSNTDFRFLFGKTLAELGRGEEAMEAFARARELGHEGAKKEMEALKVQGHRPRKPLGFLRFWKQ